MQHYADYRTRIRRMSETNPSTMPANDTGEQLGGAQPMESSTFFPMPDLLEEEHNPSAHQGPDPYKEYLRHRRKIYIIQAITFVVLAAAFIVWAIMLTRRS